MKIIKILDPTSIYNNIMEENLFFIDNNKW